MDRSGERRADAGDGTPRGPLAAPSATAADYDVFVAQVPLHMGAVLRVTAALVGMADAEDAAQEAMLRGWQAWTALRDPAAARGWLLRIAVNVCKDWQRGRFGTRRRLDEPLRDEQSGAGYALAGADPGGSDAAAALDLRAAINMLDAELREVVLLRHYAGLDSNEIGAALALPPATVRSRLRRALGLLRERLSESGTHWTGAQREGGR
jgi:RNA polymerase sigma-70 factor, ECF subfamily